MSTSSRPSRCGARSTRRQGGGPGLLAIAARGRGHGGERAGAVRTPRVAGTLRRRGKSAWLEPDDARLRGAHRAHRAGGPRRRRRRGGGGDDHPLPELPGREPRRAWSRPSWASRAIPRSGGRQDPPARRHRGGAHPARGHRRGRAFGVMFAIDALEGRVDWTRIPLPTIDPEDARDRHDAVWVEQRPDGTYKAWIAIADGPALRAAGHCARPGGARPRQLSSTSPTAPSRCCRARSRRTCARCCRT